MEYKQIDQFELKHTHSSEYKYKFEISTLM